LITAGRTALRVGDAPGARRAFETGLGEWPDDGDLVEGLARAAYLELDFAGAMELWERAYAAHRASRDPVGAVRVARTLAYMYGSVMGDWAVMSGWIARAQTLLAAAPDSAEAGWVALDLGMFEEDRARKEQHFRSALEVARRVGDADLEFVTLAYLGASLVHADRTEEGMVLLDEALAAIAGREVDDFTALEEIFCQLFSACEHAHDVVRADQWIRVGEEIARRRNLPAVSAFCRTHYGGVLTTAGRWPEADEALMEAVRLWGLGHRMLRSGALVRLADLRVRQGRFEEAEQLLDGLEDHAEAARSLAAIELARGRPALARHVLERALKPIDTTSAAAAPLMALLVDADLAAGDLPAAIANLGRLGQCATRHGSDYLVATAALARARVCLAAGDGDPCAGLSEALAAFARARLPLETARSRLELAAALAADRPQVAVAEARAALEAFERLQAARHVDAAAALLRSLGARTASTRAGTELLTKREAEILDLLGHGLSNPEIADRLYISRKTVEHHVGSILAKLGLRSRAEAAAYATRTRSERK
jgi:DNA-binding NarL/FixJ family response regulator